MCQTSFLLYTFFHNFTGTMNLKSFFLTYEKYFGETNKNDCAKKFVPFICLHIKVDWNENILKALLTQGSFLYINIQESRLRATPFITFFYYSTTNKNFGNVWTLLNSTSSVSWFKVAKAVLQFSETHGGPNAKFEIGSFDCKSPYVSTPWQPRRQSKFSKSLCKYEYT